MTAKKPTFRVMKNGYDRFAVDEAIESYASQVDELEHRIAIYQQQMAENEQKFKQLQAIHTEMVQSLEARKSAAEDIARLSLREANDIITDAQANADEIIREAIGTAKVILMDLTRLYAQAGDVKGEMKDKLQHLQEELDAFQIPKMPDPKWFSIDTDDNNNQK